MVTANSAGSASITVTTADGGRTATVSVTVNAATIPVTGVSVSPNSLTLTEGQSASVTATIQPGNATNQGVTWTSSNPSVATVNNGTITALSAGSAIVTVTTTDGGRTATVSVSVEMPTAVIDENSSIFETNEIRSGSPRTGFTWSRGYRIDLSIDFNGLSATSYQIKDVSTNEVYYTGDFRNPYNFTVRGNSLGPPDVSQLQLQITLSNGTIVEYLASFN